MRISWEMSWYLFIPSSFYNFLIGSPYILLIIYTALLLVTEFVLNNFSLFRAFPVSTNLNHFSITKRYQRQAEKMRGYGKFTGLRFFDIDMSTLTSMAELSLTYIIVLAQAPS